MRDRQANALSKRTAPGRSGDSAAPAGRHGERTRIERVQTGVRLEKRLLKVLKALAEYHDLSLGDLLEGIVLHAFDGKCPFDEDSRRRIADIKRIYGLDLDSNDSHRLLERATARRPRGLRRRRGGANHDEVGR
jgi:hypothetical protein